MSSLEPELRRLGAGSGRGGLPPKLSNKPALPCKGSSRRGATLAVSVAAAGVISLVTPVVRAADFALIGDQFLVNSYTSQTQGPASVVGSADGSFIAVWDTSFRDGDPAGVAMRRFDARGVPFGPDRIANARISATEVDAAVTTLGNGDVLVAWRGVMFDEPVSIWMRRFAPDLTPRGGDILVSDPQSSGNQRPVVAGGADGGFVVAWDHADTYTSVFDINLRAYDSAGLPISDTVLVNSYTTGIQRFQSIAAQPDGRFLIAWTSQQDPGESSLGVIARKLSSDGLPVSDEFQVDTYVLGDQYAGQIGADAEGNFVVVWAGDGEGDAFGDQRGGIFARRFDEDTTARGPEFMVNSFTTSPQMYPDVAVSPDGRFVVVWSSYDGILVDGRQDGNVRAQVYDSDGSRLGTEFRVNSYTTGYQGYQKVAVTAPGSFVIVWSTNDGSLDGVAAQRLVLDPECGDADGDRDVDSTDALVVLNGAIGQGRCEPCVCDNGPPEGVSATDALRVLQRAVGLLSSIACAACVSS